MTQKFLTFLLVFFCFACESKPVKPATPPPSAPQPAEKATPETSEPSAKEIFAAVTASPRPKDKLEQAIMTHKALQNCLLVATEVPALRLSGQVLKTGALKFEKIESENQAVSECASGALKSVSMGKGKAGPFKIELTTDSQRFKGAKGLLLAPPPVKKFQ